MSISRRTPPFSSPALTGKELLAAFHVRHPHRKWTAEQEALLSPLSLAAESLLFDHWGVLCQVADFSLTVQAGRYGPLRTPYVEIPVRPITAITSVTMGGKPLDWSLRRGFLFLPAEAHDQEVSVAFTAGWEAGRIPHPVILALARICLHWQKTDVHTLDTLAEKEMISHLLAPTIDLRSGGAQWQS